MKSNRYRDWPGCVAWPSRRPGRQGVPHAVKVAIAASTRSRRTRCAVRTAATFALPTRRIDEGVAIAHLIEQTRQGRLAYVASSSTSDNAQYYLRQAWASLAWTGSSATASVRSIKSRADGMHVMVDPVDVETADH